MQEQYKAHLLIHNIAKPKNIGTIVRNAAAFNIKTIYLIGKETSHKKKFKIADDFRFFGNHGTFDQMEFQIFPNLRSAKEYFVTKQLTVCGIEIGDGAQNVVHHPFKGNTVFFLGNEGTGLIPEHRAICDHFVYIPQYTEKTASLNVSVASGIIFHHFAIWANYKEVEMHGEKFKDNEKKEYPQKIQNIEKEQQQKQPIIQEEMYAADIFNNNID